VLATLALLGALEARAQDGPFTERGPYVSALFLGTDFRGPKPASDTDLSLFEGIGLAGAVGYRWLPLRLELEYQANVAYNYTAATQDDRFALRSLLLNGIFEVQPFRWFGLYAGAGFGQAKVGVDLDTCLSPGGCPAFSTAHTSGSGRARQAQYGVSIGPFAGHQAVLGFRRLRSGALG
jgi:opacity protein-like surface antigen